MLYTLFANSQGEIFEDTSLMMLGRTGQEWVVPEDRDLIPLPKGASLVSLPFHYPIGLNRQDKVDYLASNPYEQEEKVTAVAALLPQGFTRTLLPANVKYAKDMNLPLLGYTAVGLKNDKIYVAALQSDEHRKWHPVYYNTEGLPAKINSLLKRFPDNRIIRQLAKCSLQYSCFTAQNIFYQRWEGGIPTMATCNASCIGCISEDHAGADSPQNRLEFKPDVKEISEIAGWHLKHAAEGIISFGQGCEGEPSLNASSLAQAIEEVRAKHTDKGTININTNAGYTKGIKKMVDAGLDALRVTIFSCNEANYLTYHRPHNYKLAHVKDSINYAQDKGLQVSLNLLTFPGFTDRESEIDGLLNFVQENNIAKIQFRNLNIDPEILISHFPGDRLGIGIINLMQLLKKEIPQVKLGSYSDPVR